MTKVKTAKTTKEKTKKQIAQLTGAKMHYPKHIKELLEVAVNENMPVLLIGDTGVGKTAFIRALAQESGKELVRINLTGQTGVDELVGKMKANETGTYFEEGLLITAMRTGQWVVLDEVNMALPEITAKLFSLLDDDRKIVLVEDKGQTVSPHIDFRLFATMNPSEEYAGTKELNRSFLSRFPVVIDVDYATNEAVILQERTGVSENIAQMLVSIAQEVRKMKENGNVSTLVSTRDLIYASTLVKLGNTTENALRFAILNKFPKEERAPLQKMIGVLTGGKVTLANGEKVGVTSVLELVKINEGQNKEIKRLNEICNEREEHYTNRLQEKNDIIEKLRKGKE